MRKGREMEPNPKSELILYQTEDGKTRLDVRLQGETVRLSLNQIAELIEICSSIDYEQNGEMKELHVGGVFIFIGFVPNSSLLKVHVDHDAAGYIQTDRNMQTSVEGIWAVGDVRAQLTKQIATAVGDGTTAAVAASMYISSLKDAARA